MGTFTSWICLKILVSIKSILLPIPTIPESMSATDLINKFSKERKSIAWVVDEFGVLPAL